MKIAIYHNLPSGGAKRASHEFIKQLSKSNDIDLYISDSSAESFLDSKGDVDNFHISKIDAKHLPLKGIKKIFTISIIKRLQKKIALLIDSKDYDVVIVFQCKVTNSPYILRYLNTKHIFYCHEPASKILEPHYEDRSRSGLFKFLKNLLKRYFIRIDRRNVKNTDYLITSSKYNCEVLYKDFGIHPKLNYVGVDADKFKPLNIEKKEYVLCVGALNKAKGQDFLIKSVGTLQHKYPIRFIYSYSYGVEGYMEYLQKLADHLCVEISFSHLVDDVDLVNAYNEAYLTAFPSILEPLGLVVLESLSCETPAVAIEEAGPRETIIHNKTGLLTSRDEFEYGQAIQKLMSDNNLRNRIGINGRKNIKKFWRWEELGKEFERNINKFLHKGNDH